MEAKPRSTRRDAKRAAIVAVAKALFFEEGYMAASMAEIAARVGGSKATLYNHFRSKEELLIAVVEEVLLTMEGDVNDALVPPHDFREWLAWLGRASIARLTSYDLVSLRRLAAAEALRFPEVGRVIYDKGVAPSLELIAPAFAKAMEAGILRREDPLVLAELFVELCTGWMLRRVVWNIAPPPTEAEVGSRVRVAVDLFLDGARLR